jgi:hypothetical protein
LEIIDVLLNKGNPLNLSLISRINISAAWAHMRQQVGVRGGEDRSVFIHQAFLGTMEHLGEGKENNVDNFFHTTGKTNQNGRPDYASFAVHRNPRKDASALLGLMFLHRFNDKMEPFPDFLDVKDYV